MDQDDCQKILQSRFPEDVPKFLAYELLPLHGTVVGFIGEYYKLKITYRTNNGEGCEEFFVKPHPVSVESRLLLSKEMNAYEKETFLYDRVFRKFQEFCYDTSFAPRSYLCKDVTIVMDDLTTRGYKLFGERCFDVEHCRVSLKSLACFHANSFSWESRLGEELGRAYVVPEEFPEIAVEVFHPPPGSDPEGQSSGTKFMKHAAEALVVLCSQLPESKEWKREFVDKVRGFDCGRSLWQDLAHPKTLTHGDLWMNNMLFRYPKGSKVPNHCCLLDYQTLRYHYPSFDALLVLYYNTTRSFREKYRKELLRYYFDCFQESLRRNCYEGSEISWDTFEDSVKAMEGIALMQSAGSRTFAYLPEKVVSEALRSGATQKEILFEKRPEIALKAFESDGVFREMMIDDLYAIKEFL